MLKRRSIFLSLILVLLLLATILHRLQELGLFYQSPSDASSGTKEFVSIPGPEDLEIDRKNRILYFISNDRWATERGEATRGGLYALDLQNRNAHPILLNPESPEVFHPHGMSVWQDSTGAKVIMVINHRNDEEHTVEIYDVHRWDSLTWRESVRHELIAAPNDLVAIDDRSFYITNVSQSFTGALRQMDAFLGLGLGNVVLYENGNARVVAEDLRFANGIQMSQDGKQIFVTETVGGTLDIFSREADNSLTYEKELEIGVGLDNISVDEKGHLWIAQNPDLLALGQHMKSAE